MITHGNAVWFDNCLNVSLINQNIKKKMREYVQQKCNISIIYSLFNRAENFYGMMVSYNQNGMTFESNQYYKKGTNIFFRIKNCVFENTDIESLRTTSLAEVIKCKKFKKGNKSLYRTCVKYHEYY